MSRLGLTRESASGATSCQYRTMRSERAPRLSISLNAASRWAGSKRSRGASKVTSWPGLAWAAGTAASSSAAESTAGRSRGRRIGVITGRDTLAAAEVARPPDSTYLPVGMSVRAAAAEVTRARLIDAAIERFAADGPSVSFEAVARDAGVTKGALYHHFGS